MTNRTFEFSSQPVALIFANIKTVTKKFVDEIVRLVGNIVKMRNTIDNTIEQVQGKQK